jgi:hypothetical protein
MMNINEINTSNFKDFIALGLKTLSISILDYQTNLNRIHEVLTEYRYKYMLYDQYPSLILKMQMILDYFAKMGVFPSDPKTVWKSDNKANKGTFDIDSITEKVTKKVNELLYEFGQKEKTFIDKAFERKNSTFNPMDSYKMGSNTINPKDNSMRNDRESHASNQSSMFSKAKKQSEKKREYSAYYRDFNAVMYIKKYSFTKLSAVLRRLKSLKNNLSNLHRMSTFVETTNMNRSIINKFKFKNWHQIIRNPEIFWLNINQ